MTGTSLSMVCAPSTSHVGPFKAGSIYAKIVYSVLELQALGFEQPSKTQVALLSGYTNPETAAFRNALSIVRTKSGFVDYLSKKRVKLTDIAIQTLAPATPPPNNAAVHRRLCGVISKGKKCGPKIQQIFMMLTDGLEHAKKEVAAANGYTNTETSAFRNSLAKLGGLGLLEYPTMGANGTVQLTDLCFPYGRSGEEASSGPPPPPAVAAPAPVHVTPTSSPSISQRSSSRARKPSQRLLAAIEGNENIAPASVMVTPDEALSNIDEAILNIDPVSVDVSPDEAHTNNDEEMVNIAVAPTPDETSFDIAEGTPATSMRSAHNAISSAATVTPTPTSSNEAVFNGMATVAPGPVERRILCTLAELRALKVLPVPLMTLVLLVGYQNATSTGFQKAMSKLKGGGHVCKLSGSANMIDIAESGLELIPKVQPPQTNELVHKRLCALLGKKKGSSAKKTSEMFMLLAEGEAKTRHELMKAMGYKNLTSTGFSVAMSELKKYGLIAASGSGANGSVWLTDTCFPHGRP
uniref:Uncharacterized protein n=1 Tax=Grammatophora oceanica TaxID=210454 RepID=A0A7S1V835_9STRA